MAHIKELKPLKKNPRRHNPRNIGMIVDSLHEVGASRSIVIDENNEILAGNGTIEAAAEAGIHKLKIVEADGETIIAVRRKGLSKQQKARLAILDNRTNETSDWDADVLKALQDDGIVLDDLWSSDELSELLDGNGSNPLSGDPDEIPDTVETRCKAGDVWRLGEHRIACLDSLDEAAVKELIGGERIGMVFADPPYGMDLDTDFSKLKGTIKSPNAKGYKYERVRGDDKPFDFTPYLWIDCAEQFWWGADYYAQQLPSGGSWNVWIKRNEADAEMIGNDFELCWSKQKHKRQAIRIRWVGWDATEQNERRAHPTQKPVALAAWCFERYGKKGDVIFDPFLGSGITLLAAEQTGRRVIGCELSPEYIDVCIQRWEVMTGNEAQLIHNGNSNS